MKEFNFDIRYRPVKSEAERAEISQKVKEKFKDPNFKQRHQDAIQKNVESDWWRKQQTESSEKRKNNPEWKKRLKEGIDLLKNDPERWAEYQENYRKGNTAKYNDPAYWENYYAGIAKRDANEEYTQSRLSKSKKTVRKPVRTPLGVFETQTDATKAHGFNNTEVIRHRCKSPNFPDFEMISVEEYEKIKKDIK